MNTPEYKKEMKHDRRYSNYKGMPELKDTLLNPIFTRDLLATLLASLKNDRRVHPESHRKTISLMMKCIFTNKGKKRNLQDLIKTVTLYSKATT